MSDKPYEFSEPYDPRDTGAVFRHEMEAQELGESVFQIGITDDHNLVVILDPLCRFGLTPTGAEALAEGLRRALAEIERMKAR